MPQIYHPDKMPPLPEPDGTAETEHKPIPGGYQYGYVDAWSEPLVRAYAAEQVAAERERLRATLMEMHERDKHRHNYWACLAVELFGPHQTEALQPRDESPRTAQPEPSRRTAP